MAENSEGKKQGTATTTIKFLGENLEVLMKDRINPMFIIFLSQIEFIELKHGDGLLWLKHLRDNYGLELGNSATEQRVENILLSNGKRGIPKSE